MNFTETIKDESNNLFKEDDIRKCIMTEEQTEMANALADKMINGGKVICGEYAPGGHPLNGCAYFRYLVVKHEGKMFVIEYKPVGEEVVPMIKEVDY